MTKPSFNKRFVVYFLAIVSYVLIAYFAALNQAKEPSGYVASYDFFVNFIFGGVIIFVLFVTGIILLASSESRWYAPAFLMSCVLLPTSYVASLKVMSFLGQVRYEQEDRMIPIGSDMPKGLVVVFKRQTTNEQIEQFYRENIDFTKGLCLFTRPPSIQGHEAIEVRFCASATEEQQAQLKAKVLSSPFVFKIFDDVRPSEIKSVE